MLIPYLSQLDILILWPLAKLRRRPLILDAFLSLYNTVIEDRSPVGKHNAIAWLLFAWEWLACRAADVILVDTKAHGAYFRNIFRLDRARIGRIFIGVEPEHVLNFRPPAQFPRPRE